MPHNLRTICSHFAIYGDFISAEPCQAGHINDTYAATFDQAGDTIRYIVQRINHHVFRTPEKLMANVERVTRHIRMKLEQEGFGQTSRRALTLVPTRAGTPCIRDDSGDYWRVYLYIENATAHTIVSNPRQAYEAAKAFGMFQCDLADLPGERLHETIPDFHNTPARFQAFERAVEQDPCGRAAEVAAEIAFVRSHRETARRVVELMDAGTIPERITHNDTKLNNVLLDNITGEAVCVIDLDTLMPGSALYDFGDLVRSATCPAAEDERDLSKVDVNMPMFQALARGYLDGTDGCLTPEEVELLPFSGKLITLETGLRFLTDYLEGDVYFKTSRPGHNLDRCRTQLRLVGRIDEREPEMTDFVRELSRN